MGVWRRNVAWVFGIPSDWGVICAVVLALRPRLLMPLPVLASVRYHPQR